MRLTDDEHIDLACTLLMHSIEYGLKELMVLNNAVPPKKHELKVLLIALPSSYYNSEWYKKLDEWKHVTDDWYDQSRYSDNFSAVRSVVDSYLVAADMLLQDAEGNVSYNDTKESRVKKILNKMNSNTSASEVLRYLPDVDLLDDILYGLIVDVLKDKIK